MFILESDKRLPRLELRCGGLARIVTTGHLAPAEEQLLVEPTSSTLRANSGDVVQTGSRPLPLRLGLFFALHLVV
jgi:hypothetical protein